MENLSFDPPIEVDTSLAKKYVEGYIHFRNAPLKDKCIVFNNDVTGFEDDLKNQLPQYPRDKTIIDHEIREKFTEKLKEKCELFCQLEYMIRNNDIEDTKNHLKLIQQLLECYDAPWDSFVGIFHVHYPLLVTENTPLYCLGYGLSAIYCGKALSLFTTMKTAPLCHLFYEVCRYAGIPVHLLYIHDNDIANIEKIRSTSEACTAVFTEHADIESAVNVFLESSSRAPWKIDRILVQESIYEKTMKVFEMKGKRVMLDLPQQYIEAFETHRGPVAVALGKIDPNVVLIAAYRTTSDLMAVLTSHPARFLSVWSALTAPAMEMAIKAPVNYIWINGYGNFNGPSDIALAVYTAPLFYGIVDAQCCNQLAPLSTMWSTLEQRERKSIVLETMDKFDMNSDPNLVQAYQSIKNWKPKDPFQMSSDKITFIVDIPDSEVIYVGGDNTNILTALKLTIRGYSIVVVYCSKCTRDLILAMKKNGIPIMSHDLFRGFEVKKEKPIKAHIGNRKVIQMTL